MPSSSVEADGTFATGYGYDQPYGSFWVTSTILPFLQVTGRYVSITGIPGFTNTPGAYGSAYGKYKDKGLRVVMVAVDTDEAGQAAVTDLVKQNGVTFPVLKDIGGLTSRRFLGSRTPLPSLFIVGADGNIQAVKRGYNEEAIAALLSTVQKALGVPAEELK